VVVQPGIAQGLQFIIDPVECGHGGSIA
jgi:hypothetical protein